MFRFRVGTMQGCRIFIYEMDGNQFEFARLCDLIYKQDPENMIILDFPIIGQGFYVDCPALTDFTPLSIIQVNYCNKEIIITNYF